MAKLKTNYWAGKSSWATLYVTENNRDGKYKSKVQTHGK